MFLNKCNIFSSSQYGFRYSISTAEALIEEITTSSYFSQRCAGAIELTFITDHQNIEHLKNKTFGLIIHETLY